MAGWERTLAASGVPELRAIADSLGTLRTRLAADSFDPAEVGRLLTTLNDQVRVATTPNRFPIAAPLTQLSLLPNTACRADKPKDVVGTEKSDEWPKEYEQTQVIAAPPSVRLGHRRGEYAQLPATIKNASVEGESAPGRWARRCERRARSSTEGSSRADAT